MNYRGKTAEHQNKCNNVMNDNVKGNVARSAVRGGSDAQGGREVVHGCAHVCACMR